MQGAWYYFSSRFDSYESLVLGLAKNFVSPFNLLSTDILFLPWNMVGREFPTLNNTSILSDCCRIGGQWGFGQVDYWTTNFETGWFSPFDWNIDHIDYRSTFIIEYKIL